MSGEDAEKNTKSAEMHRLGKFSFSLQTHELMNESGETIHLRQQSSEVLHHLVERRGQLVTRSELIERVWPDTFVTDDSLAQCIADIRRALDDSEHRLVQTFPKKGYKLDLPTRPAYAEPLSDPAGGQKSGLSNKRGDMVGLSLIVLVLVLAGAFIWRANTPEFSPPDPSSFAVPLPDKPSIAVLAFDDLSLGPDKGYLSDAISEEIITRLSRFPDFFVIARNSSFHYKDKAMDVRDIAAELGVRYVLEGSQKKAGEDLRVTAQLIDATIGKTLWAETYNGTLVDIFALQDDITRTIAATLEQNINLREYERLLRQPTNSLGAYELVNRSRAERLKFTPEGHESARRLSLQALKLDPAYSEAYFSLAWVHINCFRWGWCGDLPQETALDRAFLAARKSVELDPDSSLAHWVLANATMQAGDLEQAVIAYDKSIALNPNSAGVLADSAEPLVYLGRTGEAVARLHSAIRLNPHHPDWYLWTLAWAQYFAGNYEEGLDASNAMSKMPNLARRTQAALYVRLGRDDEAKATIQTMLEHAPDYTIAQQRHSIEGKFSDPALPERFLDDLRRAGLPE